MRAIFVGVVGVFALTLYLGTGDEARSGQGEPKPDAKGWINLFPGENLEGWKRVPLDGKTKLDEKNPWKVDAKKKILHCDGVGIKEMLLYQKPFGDGVLHVEWRFPRVDNKEFGYNSGVYVRSTLDGKVWLQAQVAMLEKPPQVGDLFGDLPVKGEIKRVVEHGTGHKHVKAVGEWNAFDITCKGTTVTVQLNGTKVTSMKEWPREIGHVGLQAEFFVVEFANIKWKGF
jgi:hypothetical protein